MRCCQSLHADLTVVGQHQEDLAEGRQLSRRRPQGLPVDRLQREHAGPLGQHLRQPGVARQHLRRHRALRRARPGPRRGRSVPTRCPATSRRARCPARAPTRQPAAPRRPPARLRAPPPRRPRPRRRRARRPRTSRAGPNSGLGGLSQLLDPLLGGSGDGRAALVPQRQGRPRRRRCAWSCWPACSSAVGAPADDADLSRQRRLLQRTRPVHRRRRRRARREGRHGDPGAERGRQGARRPGRGPGHQDPRLGLRVAGGAATARVARRRPQPGLHRRARTWPPGATIPEDHTTVPVSTDEVLKELQHTLNALNPHAVGDLVTNLATDLDGQGANLNKLIAVGRRDGPAAGGQGQRPGSAQRDAGPADRHPRYRHRPDRAAGQAVRHRLDHRGPALGPAQRRHHPAGRRQHRRWSTCWCPTSSRSRRTWAR